MRTHRFMAFLMALIAITMTGFAAAPSADSGPPETIKHCIVDITPMVAIVEATASNDVNAPVFDVTRFKEVKEDPGRSEYSKYFIASTAEHGITPLFERSERPQWYVANIKAYDQTSLQPPSFVIPPAWS